MCGRAFDSGTRVAVHAWQAGPQPAVWARRAVARDPWTEATTGRAASASSRPAPALDAGEAFHARGPPLRTFVRRGRGFREDRKTGSTGERLA